MDFWRFPASRHISRANCIEINWDRQEKAAYEIFSIESSFRRFKSRFSRFVETCAQRHQRAVPPQPLLASLSWKRLRITMGMLPITTSTSDELFSRINIDDFERPWASKIRGFIDFRYLRLQRTLQEWTATKWLKIRLTVCEQELL